METLTINKAQLRAALQQWEQDTRDGKMMPADEALALPVEENARLSADFVWGLLQPMQPTYYVKHPDDTYTEAVPQPRLQV